MRGTLKINALKPFYIKASGHFPYVSNLIHFRIKFDTYGK